MRNFTYKQPKELKEIESIIKIHPGAALYAGGTDLLGLLKDELIDPGVLIDLKRIPGLNRITYEAGKGLTIGALTKIAQITEHPVIKEKYTALAQAAAVVASPQLRNIGTIGGNICQRPRCWYFRGDFNCMRKGGDTCFAVEGDNRFHCIFGGAPCFIVHPSDTAVALTAFNATLTIMSGKSKKKVPITDFFVLSAKDVTRENILNPGDVVIEIFIPEPPADVQSRYVKFTERDVWDFATVSGAFIWSKSKDKQTQGRLVLGGVAPKPWPVDSIPDALKNAEPMLHNQYKIQMVKNLIQRLLE